MSRYNGGYGQAPVPQLYHGNDPANQGWTYTGHNTCSHVAFYERDGVKADYYYTTGTMKTSMDHPVRGPTQLFRRDLSEAEHHAVLNNPRQHTGKGYYKK